MPSRIEQIEWLHDWLNRPAWTEIVRPRLARDVANLEHHWLHGTRPKGSEKLTDDDIKQRIFMLVWMLDWPKRLESLLNQQGVDNELARLTVNEGEGGSPY